MITSYKYFIVFDWNFDISRNKPCEQHGCALFLCSQTHGVTVEFVPFLQYYRRICPNYRGYRGIPDVPMQLSNRVDYKTSKKRKKLPGKPIPHCTRATSGSQLYIRS